MAEQQDGFSEELIENVPRGGDGYGMQGYPAQDAGLTQWQLEPGDVIAEIEHYLKGEAWDSRKNKGNGGWKVIHRPMLSKDGIKDLIFSLRMHMNKGVILSNFDDKEVKRLAKENRHFLEEFIFLNHKKYNIDPNSYTNIVISVDHAIFSVLKRAYKEGEKKFLGRAERRIESHVREPQRRGFIGGLFK